MPLLADLRICQDLVADRSIGAGVAEIVIDPEVPEAARRFNQEQSACQALRGEMTGTHFMPAFSSCGQSAARLKVNTPQRTFAVTDPLTGRCR